MGSPRAPPGWSAGASELGGRFDLPLVVLLGDWADTWGSSYQVSWSSGRDSLTVCTTRPNGKTRKTERCIRVTHGNVVWGFGSSFVLDEVYGPGDRVCWRPTRGGLRTFHWLRTPGGSRPYTCAASPQWWPQPAWVPKVMRRLDGQHWEVGGRYLYDHHGYLREWQEDEHGRAEVLMGWMPRSYLEPVPTMALPWAPICKVLNSFHGSSWSDMASTSWGHKYQEYLDVRMGDHVVDVHAGSDDFGWAKVARVRRLPGVPKSYQDGNLIHSSTVSGTALA